MLGESHYSDTINEIGIEEFKSRFNEIKKSAESFIKAAGFEKAVYCNERILSQMLLDYYSDIERLKEFHDIKRIRTEKIFAYTISWLIRRKPLQYRDNFIEEKDIFVNERFAAYMLLNECMCSGKQFVPSDCQKKLDEYINLLLYHFKYRECNPKTIELAISSFKMGTCVIDSDSRNPN